MDSEMTQHILFENGQKYFSRLKHTDTVALIRAPKMGSVLKDFPQFFVQVSNFGTTC